VAEDDWQHRYDESVAREDARQASDLDELRLTNAFRFRAYVGVSMLLLLLILGLAIALLASDGGWWRLAGVALLTVWIVTVVSFVVQIAHRHE